MSFNPDPSKPAQKVIFSKKLKTVPHSSITFNINPSSLSPAQKRLGLALDSKLTINEHVNHILSNVNKSIGLLRKVQPVLPRSSILTIFKTFIRSHLTTLMLFMTKVTSRRFTKNVSLFSIILP